MTPRCPECGQRQMFEDKLCPYCISTRLDRLKIAQGHADGNFETAKHWDLRGKPQCPPTERKR